MWLELQIFGFRALWSPYFLIFLIGIGVLYYLFTGRYRHKINGRERSTTKQQTFFYLALLFLYIAKGSPVDLLSHIMLTAHMIQMATLLFIIPIFLIKGLPVWIWEKIVYAPIIKPIFNLLTKPVIAALLFNCILSFYHIPFIFDFSKSSMVAHTSIHLILLCAAIIMWWPLLSPIKELDRLKPLLKLVYILVNSVLITPACALIIFAGGPLYSAYTESGAWVTALSLCVPGDVLQGISGMLSGPELFSPLSTMYDQQLGGIIMKIVQEIVNGIVFGSVLVQWFKLEKIGTIDPIPNKQIETQ